MSDTLVSALREDEGEVLHVYPDSLGFLTIGVGILVDKRKGGGITKEESAYLLNNRIRTKRDELVKALPWVLELSQARLEGLINMSFQLGVPGLLGFKNSLRMIKEGRWVEAGRNLEQSLWFKQTPNRAARVIKQIVTGEFR